MELIYVLLLAIATPSVAFRSFRPCRLISTTTRRMAQTDIGSLSSDPKSSLLGDSYSYTRTELNEYVLQLEKVNPTLEPAYSPLVNGVWEVVAAGFGSPGVIGFQVMSKIAKAIPGSVLDLADLTITISSVQPRVTAATSIKIATVNFDFSVALDLDAVSGTRLKEKYVDFKISSFDLPLTAIPDKEMIVSYLDEDLLIIRDQFGSPEILKRKKPTFQSGEPVTEYSYGSAPSA